MTTFFDCATNAACPQRPTWQISPVGYKWAQAVLLNCKQAHPCGIKKRAEAAPVLKKIGETILFTFTGAIEIFRMRTIKLFSSELTG